MHRAAAPCCHPEKENPTKDLDGAGWVLLQRPRYPDLRRGARSSDSLSLLRMTALRAVRVTQESALRRDAFLVGLKRHWRHADH